MCVERCGAGLSSKKERGEKVEKAKKRGWKADWRTSGRDKKVGEK
jgi:hypothetical protein